MKPIIKLIDVTHNAFNLSIATARTCYSSKGVLYPEDMDKTEKSLEIRDKVAKSTLKAGHLTTRQHPQFIFTIDKVSRHFVWSFLHSHPYYNSEQVSQRYVEVKPDNYYVPDTLDPKLKSLYLQSVEYATKSYNEFITLTKPYISKEFFSIYKNRGENPEKWEIPIKKKCLEVARYVLPIATHTYLYHTISGLTLYRYYRMMNHISIPEEQKYVIQQMVEEVRKVEPNLASELDDPVPLEEMVEYTFIKNLLNNQTIDIERAKQFVKQFDSEIENNYSKLVSYMSNSEKVLIDSIRATLGFPNTYNISDEELLKGVLSPEINKHLTSTLNETTLSSLSRTMFHPHYTFQKKISHTADSQDQRHRTVAASRPILMTQFTGEPDYITPEIIQLNPELNDAYQKVMKEIFYSINQFIDAGGSAEHASYLLPNAFPIRFYESGNLLNLHHKWKSRLCYNAQEEIFNASLQEVMDIRIVQPNLVKWIGSPCKLRFYGNTKPYCPEGDKYCGVPVWKKEIEEYRRVL